MVQAINLVWSSSSTGLMRLPIACYQFYRKRWHRSEDRIRFSTRMRTRFSIIRSIVYLLVVSLTLRSDLGKHRPIILFPTTNYSKVPDHHSEEAHYCFLVSEKAYGRVDRTLIFRDSEIMGVIKAVSIYLTFVHRHMA